MSESLRNCTLVPIPKGQKDPTISDNYRPIALSPTVSKALEWVILLEFSQFFVTNDLQFGFKKGMSTSLCTGLLKNTISHYIHRGSNVFSCFLDASKAFDLVNHCTLFKKLMARGLPTVITHLCILITSRYVVLGFHS